MYLSYLQKRQLTNWQRFSKRLRRLWLLLARWEACFIVVFALLAIVLGFIGVALIEVGVVPEEGEEPISWFNWLTDTIYETAQLLIMDMDPHKDEYNIFIGLGRVFAVCVLITVAVRAIRLLFRTSFQNVLLKFRGHRHVFIAGLGRIGLEVALERARESFVIAREVEDIEHWTGLASEHGVMVQHGDVTDPLALAHIVAYNPSEVYLVTGNDKQNVDALAQLEQVRKEREEKPRKPVEHCRAYVHIENNSFLHSLHRGQSEKVKTGHAPDNLEVHYFNVNQAAAEHLIVSEITPNRPKSPDEVALFVVVGCGSMGESMIKAITELAHFENLKRSRILVLSKEHEKDAAHIHEKWPQLSSKELFGDLAAVNFGNVSDEWGDEECTIRETQEDGTEKETRYHVAKYAANVKFCKTDSDDFLTHAEIEALVNLVQVDNVRPYVIFCHDEEDKNFKTANEFNVKLADFHNINRADGPDLEMGVAPGRVSSIPSYVFLPKHRSLRQVTRNAQETELLVPFGSVTEGIHRVQEPLIQELAMVYAWAYDKHTGITDLSEFNADAYRPTWNKMEYWAQYSNICAAEHAWIKLQIVDIAPEKVARGASVVSTRLASLRDAEKELLSLIEHNRFLAERLLQDWKFGPKSDVPPKRLTMCAVDGVDSEEFEKDKAQIKALCKHIARQARRLRKS